MTIRVGTAIESGEHVDEVLLESDLVDALEHMKKGRPAVRAVNPLAGEIVGMAMDSGPQVPRNLVLATTTTTTTEREPEEDRVQLIEDERADADEAAQPPRADPDSNAFLQAMQNVLDQMKLNTEQGVERLSSLFHSLPE